MASVVRERICGSKVRTGCSTCKARHIKCTEERPSCRRCVTSSRTCNYEAIRPRRRPNEFTFVNYAAQVRLAISQHSSWDPQERRALNFFRERTALDLAGPLSPRFFSEVLLSVAEDEPTVRYALSALGTAHEVYVHNDLRKVPEFALRQYGKAIQGIVDLQATEDSSAVEIVLTTCIIFALLESMRGFHHSCLSHLTAGLKVLRENQMSDQSQSSKVRALTRTLQWIFIRVDSQVLDIGGAEVERGVQVYCKTLTRIPSEFRDVDHAIFHVELLYNRIMYHLSKWEPIISVQGQGRDVQKPLFEERQYYAHEFDTFKNAYRRLLADNPATQSDRHEAALLAISLSMRVITLLLGVKDFIKTETQFDQFLSLFQEIVAESEVFIEVSSRSGPEPSRLIPQNAVPPISASDRQARHDSADSDDSAAWSYAPNNPRPHRAILTMSSGCVLPLYMAAARCRHGPTRHKALHLLKTCNRREGLWDSALAAGMAEKLITLEESKARALLLEQQYHQQQQFNLSNNLSGSIFPTHDSDDFLAGVDNMTNDLELLEIPDEARIRTVVMHYGGEEEGGRAEFSMQPPWSVVSNPGARFDGLRSVENIAFGTPGPRAVVTEVILEC